MLKPKYNSDFRLNKYDVQSEETCIPVQQRTPEVPFISLNTNAQDQIVRSEKPIQSTPEVQIVNIESNQQDQSNSCVNDPGLPSLSAPSWQLVNRLQSAKFMRMSSSASMQ